MARLGIFEMIAEQRATGRPFAMVTVIRTADATSAKAGAKALVTESGEILGHVGGGCVQGALRRAAAEALESGAVSTIRIKPAGEVVSAFDTDGTALHKSGCPSGGTIELLIEPYAPPPAVVVAGASPVAAAIGRIAHVTGYRVCHAAPAGDHGLIAEAERTVDGFDLAPLDLTARDFVVVAAQGKGDLDALRAALLSPATYVAMVASGRKARALLDRLRAEGIDEARLTRLKSPAGLDLGGIDPEEIAVSVIAEIVQTRNRRAQPIGKPERVPSSRE
ncbi:MAG: XdhC family protein [Alphaproteobacteria bacterium]